MNHSIAVLPDNVSFEASQDATRFLKLPHPRTGAPALYLPALKTAETAEHGNVQVLLEVQAVNATGDKQRSWFTGDDKVIGDGKMLLLTPFDPVFLLVRILLVVGQSQKDSKARVSLPYEDIFDSASSLLRFPSTSSKAPDTPRSRSKRQKLDEEQVDEVNTGDSAEDEAAAALLAEDMRRFGELECTKKAMACICQVQEITSDLATYRLDDQLLQRTLKSKVDKLSTMEAFNASSTLSRVLAKEGITEAAGVSAELHAEARQKAALDLLSGFLPKEASSLLKASYSFPKYEAYLSGIGLGAGTSSSNLSAPALSAASSSASISSVGSDAISTFGMPKRRSAEEREEAEKKSKKKPTMESLGVRQLKKVSTRGMSPLTSFFTKKTPTPSPNSETPPTS